MILTGNCVGNCNCGSVLLLQSPVTVLFYLNKAPQGGAVYVDDTSCTYDMCLNVTKDMAMA